MKEAADAVQMPDLQVQMNISDPALNKMMGIPATRKTVNRFHEALTLEQAGKIKEAEEKYIELLNDHFGNVALHAALGMNYAVQGKHGLSNLLLNNALTHFSDLEKHLDDVGVKTQETEKGGRERFMRLKKSEMMNAIGTTWKHENKIDKARYWFERAKETLGEPSADIENNLATLYINEGHPERCMPHLDEAIRIDPNHAQARWNRALANLETGEYAKGFDEYGWGKRAQVRMDRNYSTHQIPEWDGSPGKSVVVYGEQGIGDEILFASCIPDLVKDSREVVFDCHKKLHRLFCNSFPQLDIYGTREDENITWPFNSDGTPHYTFDAKIAIGDLPKFYRRKIEDFPGTTYIRPTTEAELRWAQRLNEIFTDGKPLIGINWIGGHKKTRVEVRSMKLEEWLPLLQQDAHFISLQYTEGCEDEIFEFEQKHGIKIHHWPEASKNEHYDETGGLVANLDLVVTCCSSIVHLAGSMAVPTWVLVPSRPAWRYGIGGGPAGDRMPWYGDTVVLFRQAIDTVEWKPVIDEVATALRELNEEKHD